ncbi:MAG TPA: response regulator [Terriglobales bacterium]|nr:response regulator [Terriglobales bacterium]
MEDNPDDLEPALYALRREYLANNIFTVRDGEEALEFLFCNGRFDDRNFDHPPRLVLLDLKLPKLNGLDVLKRIKQDARTKAVPVVILTSSKEERDLVASYNIGANSYIQKPVDFDQFREIGRNAGLYWMVINQQPMSNPVQAAAATAGN